MANRKSMKKTLNIKGRLVDLSAPKVMGILNVTPDSFYEGSRIAPIKKDILKKINTMVADGVDIVDVGGYSTRPFADDISIRSEMERVVPVVEVIKTHFPDLIVSVDTFRSDVALAAIRAGADMINDISGGDLDPQLPSLVAQEQVPYLIMHTRGTPQTMTYLTNYTDITLEVMETLQQKVRQFEEKGIKDILIDPGFGFAKTIEQNFELMNKMDYLTLIKRPLVVGISRKSMIWKTLNTTANDVLHATSALNLYSLQKGASILRVHDVKEAKEIIRLFECLIVKN